MVKSFAVVIITDGLSQLLAEQILYLVRILAKQRTVQFRKINTFYLVVKPFLNLVFVNVFHFYVWQGHG